MPTNAVEYVSQLGMGDETACTATMNAIAAAIRERNAVGGRSVNFSLRVLYGFDHAENELIETKRLHQLTGAVYRSCGST